MILKQEKTKTMQATMQLYDKINDLPIEGKKVMIGVSGGINSAAVACYLAKYIEDQPSELFLYYAHFDEHSPDTEAFVESIFKYCKEQFKNIPVHTKVVNNSILGFYNKIKSVVPPQSSTCTRLLKILPIAEYMHSNQIDYDLIGYVRGEERRVKRQKARGLKSKIHPITHLSDDDCFSLVKREIGWYPEIYDIKWTDERIEVALKNGSLDWLSDNQKALLEKYHKRGRGFKKDALRVFKHNNCLPCKNMHAWELATVQIFYPEIFNKALKTAEGLGKYLGRKNEFNETPSSCTVCAY